MKETKMKSLQKEGNMEWNKFPDVEPKDMASVVFVRCCQEHTDKCFCRECHIPHLGLYIKSKKAFFFDGDGLYPFIQETEEYDDEEKIYKTVVYWIEIPNCPCGSSRTLYTYYISPIDCLVYHNSGKESLPFIDELERLNYLDEDSE